MRRCRSLTLLACMPLAGCAGASFGGRTEDPAALAALPEPTPAAALPLPGERLEFAIALAGLPVGSAQFATARLDDGWQFNLTGATNTVIDWFCAVRGLASARLRDDLSARSFALWLDEDGEKSARSLAYDEVPTLWYRAPGQTAWLSELTQYLAPRDPLSLLQQLRTLEPAIEPRDFEVAMTLQSFCYRVRFLGREDVAVGAGDFAQALCWRVEVHPYEQLGTNTTLGPLIGFYEIAISADARRLPLAVRREFGFGQVALELVRSTVDPAATATLAAVNSAPAAAIARE